MIKAAPFILIALGVLVVAAGVFLLSVPAGLIALGVLVVAGGVGLLEVNR